MCAQMGGGGLREGGCRILRFSRNVSGITVSDFTSVSEVAQGWGFRRERGGKDGRSMWVNEGWAFCVWRGWRGVGGWGAVQGKPFLCEINLIPELGWLFSTVSCSVCLRTMPME